MFKLFINHYALIILLFTVRNVSVVLPFNYFVDRVVLIGSVPGRHVGEKKSHFGHLKLRKVSVIVTVTRHLYSTI